jgi:hypothetical protein
MPANRGNIMIHLLNSAMMPNFGEYDYREVKAAEFAHHLAEGHRLGLLRSYVGYQETADLLSDLAGVPVAVNRDSTELQHGDTLLIARLRSRLGNPAAKGRKKPDVEDFVFGVAEYRAPGSERFYRFTEAAQRLYGDEALAEWADAAEEAHREDPATPWAAYFWQLATAGMPAEMYEAIENELRSPQG